MPIPCSSHLDAAGVHHRGLVALHGTLQNVKAERLRTSFDLCRASKAITLDAATNIKVPTSGTCISTKRVRLSLTVDTRADPLHWDRSHRTKLIISDVVFHMPLLEGVGCASSRRAASSLLRLC